MEISTADKIRAVAKAKGVTLTQLAERMNTSRQNLGNMLRRDNFTPQQLSEIAAILEVKYKSVFVLEDGTEI